MFYTLASKLAVVNGTDAFSAAVPMGGDNALQLSVTVFANTATSITVVIEVSNDGENWSLLVSYAGLVLGYAAPNLSTSVGFKLARLHYTVVGAGTVILAADLNTSFQ